MSGRGFNGGDDLGEAAEIQVDHPSHYGDASDPYEAIKVMEAWAQAGEWDHVTTINLTQALKYIRRHGQKVLGSTPLKDLEKARWYLERTLAHLVARQEEARR